MAETDKVRREDVNIGIATQPEKKYVFNYSCLATIVLQISVPRSFRRRNPPRVAYG